MKNNVPRITNIEPVFAVWTNTDTTEGRGMEYVFAYCTLEATAKRLAKGGYVMGSDCPITKENLYCLGSHWYYPGARITAPTSEDKQEEIALEAARVKAQKKAEVLAKAKSLGMTDEEIKALS